MAQKLVFALFLMLLLPSLALSGGEWYSGGNLHNVKCSKWKNASYRNKLATCADWAANRPWIKKKVQASGDLNTLKPYANQLLRCMDEAITGPESNNMSTARVAASCMVLMGWE
jgi:hypothetical protein